MSAEEAEAETPKKEEEDMKVGRQEDDEEDQREGKMEPYWKGKRIQSIEKRKKMCQRKMWKRIHTERFSR